jgi:hypothetical protein
MKINILTPDSKKANLAAMKISAWHKSNGDDVMLNFQLRKADFTYASVLFKWTADPIANLVGGSKYPDRKLDPEIDKMFPDYSLYPHLDHSIGYTYKACPRTCEFCVVPKQDNDTEHYSIWDFHDPKFKKIKLMNNNTFADLNWRETFKEIIEAGLTVVDESGFDLRLMNGEQVNWLQKIKFEGVIHYAWDRMQDETEVLCGLKIAPKGSVYVLIGYDTTIEEDIHRFQKIVDFGHDPYIMPYTHSKHEMAFKRFRDSFMWRKYGTIAEAWKDYKK